MCVCVCVDCYLFRLSLGWCVVGVVVSLCNTKEVGVGIEEECVHTTHPQHTPTQYNAERKLLSL